MHASLTELFRALDERPTVAAYLQAAREIPALKASLLPLRVALLSTFTIDSLVPYLSVEAARCGFAADIYVAPFNSVRQELLDPSSGCHRHRPDVVFLVPWLADVCPPLACDYLGLNGAERARHVETVAMELAESVRVFRSHCQAAVAAGNFVRPRYPPLGLYEGMASESLTATVAALNARLAAELGDISGACILDLDRVCADVGYRNALDERLWHLARAPLSAAVLPALAAAQADLLRVLAGPRRKCLVLDLDNTLWGGIVGESGVAGIKLGHTYPGNVYREFQQKVLELHRRGVILALNSKNNPGDVEEVFRSHPDMVLRREHFASVRANWQDKPANMREIAGELNIGTDSLVFFDDSPVERQLMRQSLPEVLTLEVPADPTYYVRALCDRGPFDRLSLTAEDLRRGEMYRQQAGRQELRAAAASMEEFLTSLGMTARVRRLDSFAIPRALDLLQKTNQFNLTTRRHSAPEIERMMNDPAWAVFTLQVLDRFGDEGIVGVAILERRNVTARLDSFLMSCRVIGRTVETALLSFLADWARSAGLDVMEGEFIPTAKNAPAADFYERHGFTPAGDNRWRLELAAAPFTWPGYIAREAPAPEQITIGRP